MSSESVESVNQSGDHDAKQTVLYQIDVQCGPKQWQVGFARDFTFEARSLFLFLRFCVDTPSSLLFMSC